VLRAIQRFFDTRIRADSASASPEVSRHALQLATAALLIEMTRADFRVKEKERRTVMEAIQRTFDLTPDETQELIRLAEQEAAESVSLYQFTRLVDKGFSLEQKKHVVELLWRVAFADEEMEKHEEYLVRKIADLLHVPHRDFIQAKLRARQAVRQGE